MDGNKFTMTLPSKSCNESFARVTVAAFASRLDPTLEEIADIKTSVSEAVTNCSVHAYPDRIGMIYITCEIIGEDTVKIRIRDRGCGIENVKQAMETQHSQKYILKFQNDTYRYVGFGEMQNHSSLAHIQKPPVKLTGGFY